MNIFIFTEALGIDYLGNLVVAELLSNPNINVYITEIPTFLFPDCSEKTTNMYGMGYTISKKVPLKCKNAVVVHEDYRGMGISQKILNLLKKEAEENNCYKIILDCKEELIPVYEKNGFTKKGVQMIQYI